jgi:hypothetical protein
VQAILIVAVSIVAAVIYGIVHDQITARICVEYFTIGHPPVFDTTSPTLLGIGWGIIATWWMGVFLGAPLAIAACAGARPKRTAATLVRPVATLLLVMGICAFLSGLTGYVLAKQGAVRLVGPLATAVPRDRHVPFLTDLWAHDASYLVGFFGGLVVIARVWRSRGEPAGPSGVHNETRKSISDVPGSGSTPVS